MNYSRTHADDTVTKLYKTHDVIGASSITPEIIAERLGLEVIYLPVDSMRINNQIYLDERLPPPILQQQFGHELCHILWHQDNQLKLEQSFIDMQERQADNFALYACIPTDMLLDITLPSTECEAVGVLTELFNITPEFALKRLKLHLSKMYQTTY